jgi:hypothetical protein
MGDKVSFGGKSAARAPQAVSDSFSITEDEISYLDALLNDLGSKSLVLYSLYDGVNPDRETTASLASVPVLTITTGLGATAKIVASGTNAGRIEYDASALDWLAEDEAATDTSAISSAFRTER